MRKLLYAMLGGALLAVSANATTLGRMSEKEMVDRAELIVAGRCTRLESRWLGGTLFTLVHVTVDETMKGAASAEVMVAVPGGVDLDRTVPAHFRGSTRRPARRR